MRELGAPRWDPTPVDQLEFFLDEIPGESALQRMLAWLRAHTIKVARWGLYSFELATGDGNIVLFKTAIEIVREAV